MKVKDHSNLYKKESGVIVVKDPQLQKRIANKRKEKERIEALENKVDNIENLLMQIIEKLDGNSK